MAYCPARRVYKPLKVNRAGSEQGTALVEFVLATGLLIVPLFFGIISVGLSLILANQVTEVCRDTGHMFAYYVDFSQPPAQELVTNQLAAGLGITPTGGRGVIYLSTIELVGATDCVSAGLATSTAAANSSNCPNINQVVVVKRLTIGNAGNPKPSTYAPSITPGIIESSGAIGSSDFMTDTSVRTPNFTNLISLGVDQYAYVCEMFVNPPVGGLWSLFGSNVVMARSVF